MRRIHHAAARNVARERIIDRAVKAAELRALARRRKAAEPESRTVYGTPAHTQPPGYWSAGIIGVVLAGIVSAALAGSAPRAVPLSAAMAPPSYERVIPGHGSARVPRGAYSDLSAYRWDGAALPAQRRAGRLLRWGRVTFDGVTFRNHYGRPIIAAAWEG